MKKCLMLVTQSFDNKILNGGDVINKRNYQFLKDNFDVVDILICRQHLGSRAEKIYSKISNVINLSMSDCKADIKKYIKDNVKLYDLVFIGQSSLGEFAKYIKQIHRDAKVITFFHNVEFNYYRTQASFIVSPMNLFAEIACLNEKDAVKFSDMVIALNERDSAEIFRLYGKKADLLLPTSFKNKITEFNKKIINKNEIKLLFIGSNFFPNKQGVIWFIKNVFNKLDNVKLEIVGRGTDIWLNDNIFNSPRIKIYGAVDNLDYYYQHADAVVIPIFTGGGMKTKTAEALMYGKYIFATKEAFEGYNIDYDKVGALCNSSDEFIKALTEFSNSSKSRYNAYARECFLEFYDEEIIKENFKTFIFHLE